MFTQHQSYTPFQRQWLNYRRVLAALVLLITWAALAWSFPAHAQTELSPTHINILDATADTLPAEWSNLFLAPGIGFEEMTDLAMDAEGRLFVCCTAPEFNQYEILVWNGASWLTTSSRFDRKPEALVAHGTHIFAVGPFEKIGGTTARGIAQWDGERWSRVGSGPGPQRDNFDDPVQGEVRAAAIYQGDLIIAGTFDTVDGVPARNIARWDGAAWHALDEGMQVESSFDYEQGVYALAVDGDLLYAGGQFIAAGTVDAAHVAVWNGTAWDNLGSGIDADGQYGQRRITTLAAGNGRLYAGGIFSGAGGQDASNIALWNGTAWRALGDGLASNLNVEVRTLLYLDNTLYAGGRFTYAGGEQIYNLARYRDNAWSPVPQTALNEFDGVNALVAHPQGGFMMAGSFTRISDVLVHNVAHYHNGAWFALGYGLTSTDTGTQPGRVHALATDASGNVYAGGFFVTANGITVNNIAVWDGEAWYPLGAGVLGDGGAQDGTVHALAFYKGELYVGGDFTRAGNMPAKHLAKWNPATRQWSEVGGGVDGPVHALTVGHDRLYVGGDFKTVGSLDVTDVAFWNGTGWGAPSNSLRIYEVGDQCGEVGTQVYALAIWQDMLVIGGNFRLVYAGGDICAISSYRLANHMLLWDHQADEWFFAGTQGVYGVTDMSGVFGRPISALAVVGQDVYVGGSFGKAGGVNVSRLARFTPQGWSSVGGGVSGTANNCALCTGPEVISLLAAGTQLYVTGDFLNTGSGPANNIAVFDTAKQNWTNLGAGLKPAGIDPAGRALALGGDGLYVGGAFDQAGGRSATGFSFWPGVVNLEVVGPQGGALQTAQGVKLTLPEGAVNAPTLIQHTPLAANTLNLPAQFAVLDSFRMIAANADGTLVEQFAKPYTLEIPYPATQVEDPTQLNVQMRTGNGPWTPLLPCDGCSVNPQAGKVTVRASHFTDFALTLNITSEPEPQPNAPRLYIPSVRK